MHLLAESIQFTDVVHYLLAVVVGFVAGFINTLAGNGSAITVPMLIFLGLPADEANGTNRIGVVLSSMVSAATFRSKGLLEVRALGWALVPAAAGGVIGAYIASRIEAPHMEIVVIVAMLIMLVLIVARPGRWIKDAPNAHEHYRKPSTIAILFVNGVYGGFIQMGVGILLLGALVLKAGFSLVRANPIKVVTICAITMPALVVFLLAGQVRWEYGLLMASGQMTGAYLAARFAAEHPRANIWIHRLLIVMVVAMLVLLIKRQLEGLGFI